MSKLLFLVAEDWYFVSHRLPLAIAAQKKGFDVIIATRFSKHRATIEAANLSTVPFEMDRRSLNPFRLLREALSLAALYRRERPDIVHHVALRPVVVGALAARFVGLPNTVSAIAGLGFLFTDGGRKAWARLLLKKGLPWLLSRGVTIVQNSDDQSFLESLGVPRSQIRLIAGAGVDIECFRPGSRAEGTPIVMLASRLLWDKGVAEFIEAARHLKGKARFVLVGAPDADNPSSVHEAQLHAWVKEGVVEWWGPKDDMPTVLNRATIFCLPSYYREGMPKVLLEAMATGLPCVTTNVPGCRDAVEHEVSGFLVPPRDADALSIAIDRLLCDGDLRNRLGKAARQRVENHFGSHRIIDATLQIYRELI